MVRFGLLGALCTHIYAAECLSVTGVRCTTECDNREQFKGCDGNLYGKTFFSFRPQDSDSSRRILTYFNADYVLQTRFQQDLSQQETAKEHYYSRYQDMRYMLTISPQYTRSFNPKQIAQWFFFSGCDSMTVGIPDDQTFDIDGSQIGLSLGTNYDAYTETVSLVTGKIGSVWARPLVENYIIDIDFWYDLSAWHDNLWSRLECPIVYMKTNMRMCAKGRGNQADEYPVGLFSLDSTVVDIYGDELCNATPVPYNSIICALEGNQGWDAVQPLQSGKFPSHSLDKWSVAGLHFDLGYDMYDSWPWFVSGSFHMVFPTGNRPQGTYVFEPIIGANKSWQVGATAAANYIKEFKRGEFGIYFYAVGTHLFKSAQDRVFAMANNGPGSQLLLLKQFTVGNTGLINAEREANIFCGRTKIGATLMFDGSLMFQYSFKKFVLDVGYNFWARTKEKRSKIVLLRGFYNNIFGVKGDTPMEEVGQLGCDYTPIQCLADLTTEMCATIAAPTTNIQSPAVFIAPCNINFGSALSPAVMSHKVFAATGYKSSWFILLSGEAEFGTNNAVINQWGVMLKFGKEF